jgi:hypothetical protein
MSESFTAVEYAILVHLKTQGRATIPALAADLLLRPSEVETALSGLVAKNFSKKEGDFYLPGDVCLDVPVAQEKKEKSGTFKIVRPMPMPAAAPAAAMPEVANVFKQARDRARREKAGGGV